MIDTIRQGKVIIEHVFFSISFDSIDSFATGFSSLLGVVVGCLLCGDYGIIEL